jgi:hypothetical protein
MRPISERERAGAMLDALRYERAGVETKLAGGRLFRAHAEERLANIDAEIRRIGAMHEALERLEAEAEA